jgi:hypothetical protein
MAKKTARKGADASAPTDTGAGAQKPADGKAEGAAPENTQEKKDPEAKGVWRLIKGVFSLSTLASIMAALWLYKIGMNMYYITRESSFC